MKPLTEEQLKQIAYEDATPDNQLTPEERQRKDTRNRQRKSRAKQREEKLQERQSKEAEAARAAELAMSISQWHDYNRSKLSDQELEQLKARQETTLDTLDWINENIAGTYNPLPENYVSVEEGLDDLDADVRKFGTTYAYETLCQHVEQYRESASFRDKVRNYGPRVFHDKNATEVWLTIGLLVALPSQRVCDFYMSLKPKVQLPTYVVMECSVCKSIASRTNVPQHIADDYRRLQIPYKCGVCRGQQTALMNRATKYNEVVKKPSIFDQFGRIKDRD